MQPLAQLVGVVLAMHTALASEKDAGARDTRKTCDTDDLPRRSHPPRRLPGVNVPTLTLAEAVASAATGDIWLFRGRSAADFAIRAVTNSPVNHVGMVVAIDDLPPLLWHAELRSLAAGRVDRAASTRGSTAPPSRSRYDLERAL